MTGVVYSVNTWLKIKPADHRDAERLTERGALAYADRKRQCAEHGGGGRHHDGPQTDDRRIVNGLLRLHLLVALQMQGEVDHHDGVLLDDADEQDDADERDHGERRAEDRGAPSVAPIIAEGSVERIVIGWMVFSYRIPSTM